MGIFGIVLFLVLASRSRVRDSQESECERCSIGESYGFSQIRQRCGIKMGIFIKKNKLNNSSKWFTFGQKIRP